MLSATIAPQNKKQLDLIHHEAARIITGGTKLCSIQKLLSELGWETLQERRSKHKLVIFYKIINGLTPDYLSDLLPPIVQDNVTYNLRNANNMRSLRARTNLYFNSFFPSSFVPGTSYQMKQREQALYPHLNIS